MQAIRDRKRLRPVIAAGLALVLVSNCAVAEKPDPLPATAPRDEELRVELMHMMRVDQEARLGLDFKNLARSPNWLEKLREIDRAHTERMKAIVRHGWPGRSLVGDDGANAAWLLVQHAGNRELPFLEKCLELMRAAVEAGEASPKDLAYLIDRVRMYQGKPQVYGTQFKQADGGAFVLYEIEDADRVELRRRSVGLPSLGEQEEMMRAFDKKPRVDRP
jgi:hypothetical protein